MRKNIRNKIFLYDLNCLRLVVSQTASVCICTASDATKCFPSQCGRWQPDHFISISYLNGRGFCISEKRWDPKSTPSFYYTVLKTFFFLISQALRDIRIENNSPKLRFIVRSHSGQTGNLSGTTSAKQTWLCPVTNITFYNGLKQLRQHAGL